MRRLVPIACLLAAAFACKGDSTRNESMNTLTSIPFGPGDPGSFAAVLSATVQGDNDTTVSISGEIQLDMNPFDPIVVSIRGAIDGETVAEQDVDFSDPFPQDVSLSAPGVLDDCEIGVPCDVRIEFTVNSPEDGVMPVVTGSAKIQASDVAIGEVVVEDFLAILEE